MEKQTERQELERDILGLAGDLHKTLAKVEAVQARHASYMAQHPADDGFRSWGEMLAMLQGVYS
ncbi:MAG: hypothetical protein KAY24_00275 [Candidatus Eisenbacteria sp.]|nr:hypothetical protein [Candidatus Eisenbacteria bacterium]